MSFDLNTEYRIDIKFNFFSTRSYTSPAGGSSKMILFIVKGTSLIKDCDPFTSSNLNGVREDIF